nr:hypothetical protein [Tanacetum cinerariifolium]
MQKRRNDVKARTTLLLALPDEHQLRFSKYKMAQELWAAILKTFGGNEATKKTMKNLLKQQYGNFKAEGKDTLEQTFNRLQRNRSDLDTMSLDDLYNHLKVYEPEVQKKLDSQNMVFISSSKNSSGNKEDNTAGKKISIQGTDVAGFDKLKGRKDNYRQGSKVKEQAPKALMMIDRLGWDWSFMANEKENHALIADEEAPTEFALMAKTSADSEVIEFGDSYVVPTNNTATVSISEGTVTKKGRTVSLTTEDIQKRINDVKARTTLLLALPDEHQLRLS